MLFQILYGRRLALPAPAGAVIMAVGIFVSAAMQQMPSLRPATEFLTVALLVVWALMAASYAASCITGRLSQHCRPLVGRFAIGTWIAGTAVVARLVLQGVPEWKSLAIALAVFAFVMWIWFLKLVLEALPKLSSASDRGLVPGVILLSTVSTQSIVLVALDLLPWSPMRLWATAILIAVGAAFYTACLVLIVRSHIRVAGWTLAGDWDNTNCILHGAMSITGLALASHPAVPAWITLLVWYYALSMFLVIEAVEIVRLGKRIGNFGWQAGAFSYRITQWSRNFTFGMFYAFTLQLPQAWQLGGSAAGLRAAILAWGPYMLLALLIAEFALFGASRLQEASIVPDAILRRPVDRD